MSIKPAPDFWERFGDAYPRTAMIVACAFLGGTFGGFGAGLWNKAYGGDPVAGLLGGGVFGGLCGAAVGALFALPALPALALSLLGLFFLVGFVRWAWAWWS